MAIRSKFDNHLCECYNNTHKLCKHKTLLEKQKKNFPS